MVVAMMQALPSGENQRHARAPPSGGSVRTVKRSGHKPPSQAPAANRCTTSETSRTLGPPYIDRAWLCPACAITAAVQGNSAQLGARRRVTRLTITAAVWVSQTWPKAVAPSTFGTEAASARRSWPVCARSADCKTAHANSSGMAATRLVVARPTIRRSAISGATRAASFGNTMARNSSAPKADRRAATDRDRATTSGQPPSGLIGNIPVSRTGYGGERGSMQAPSDGLGLDDTTWGFSERESSDPATAITPCRGRAFKRRG